MLPASRRNRPPAGTAGEVKGRRGTELAPALAGRETSLDPGRRPCHPTCDSSPGSERRMASPDPSFSPTKDSGEPVIMDSLRVLLVRHVSLRAVILICTSCGDEPPVGAPPDLASATQDLQVFMPPRDFAGVADQQPLTSADMTVGCSTTGCPLNCTAPARCVSASVSGNFPPVCLRPCTTNQDCGNMEHCVKALGAIPDDRYCITAIFPPACRSDNFCTSFFEAYCMKNIYIKPYNQPVHATCGPEYIACGDGGCTTTGGCQ